jgi:hypothetical protein
MNVTELIPAPVGRESFMRNRYRFVPDVAGCYALTTFTGTILYVGLTNDLRRRMNEHLDSSEKTSETSEGRAIFFQWWQGEELEKVERTWMNIHIQNEGRLPIMNGVYSPVSG